MSARRRAAERARLDLLAAEAYADHYHPAPPERFDEGHDRAVAAFLAGVRWERRRTRLVWRRRAPEWLQITAMLVVAALTVVAIWLFLVVLAWAGDAVAPVTDVQLPTI